MQGNVQSAEQRPAVDQIGLKSIDAGMDAGVAATYDQALAAHYNSHFGRADWDWNDVHERDKDVFVALNEIIGAKAKGRAVDEDLIAGFEGEPENKRKERVERYTEAHELPLASTPWDVQNHLKRPLTKGVAVASTMVYSRYIQSEAP